MPLYSLIPLGDAPDADGFDLVAIIAAVTEPDVFTFEQPAAIGFATETVEAAVDTSSGAEYREEPDPAVGWHDALLFA